MSRSNRARLSQLLAALPNELHYLRATAESLAAQDPGALECGDADLSVFLGALHAHFDPADNQAATTFAAHADALGAWLEGLDAAQESAAQPLQTLHALLDSADLHEWLAAPSDPMDVYAHYPAVRIDIPDAWRLDSRQPNAVTLKKRGVSLSVSPMPATDARQAESARHPSPGSKRTSPAPTPDPRSAPTPNAKRREVSSPNLTGRSYTVEIAGAPMIIEYFLSPRSANTDWSIFAVATATARKPISESDQQTIERAVLSVTLDL